MTTLSENYQQLLNPTFTGSTKVGSFLPPIDTSSSPVIKAIDVGKQTAISLPPTPPISNTGVGNNTTVPSPIPTVESVVDTGAVSTPAETQQKGILDRIAGLIGGGKGKTELTNTAEANAGLPGQASILNDLNTQLEGLNNQSLALQNEALPGGAIQNKNDLAATGRMSLAGEAPHLASDLRMNQIKQSTIASQSLTLKSLIYAVQGKYNIAKDAADKAADAQYEHQEQEIAYQKAQLDALTPTLNKEEKTKQAIQTAKLADRQNQINNAKEDKKTIIAMATAALKNNPTDQQAQYNAQEAIAESNKDVPDLNKVFSLIGQYQTDPIAVQNALLENAYKRASIAKINADIETMNNPTGLVTSAGKPLNASQSTSLGYANRVAQATQDIDALASEFSATTIQNLVGGYLPHYLQTSDRQVLEQASRNFINANLRKESGAAISPTEFKDAYAQYIPVTGDLPDVLARKKANRDLIYKNLLNDAGNPQGLGVITPPSNSSIPKGTDGASYGHPGYVSDGTQWVEK